MKIKKILIINMMVMIAISYFVIPFINISSNEDIINNNDNHLNKDLVMLRPIFEVNAEVSVVEIPKVYKEVEVNKEENIKEKNPNKETKLDKVQKVETEIKKKVELKKKQEKKYSDEELYMLSHLIYAESGGCSWEHQIAVGSVVLNRIKDSRFPDTMKDVIFQKGQYSCTWNGGYKKNPSQTSIDVAKYLLKNGSQLPKYCIFQAEFLQGDSVYKKIGNTYFCYYERDKINAEKNNN